LQLSQQAQWSCDFNPWLLTLDFVQTLKLKTVVWLVRNETEIPTLLMLCETWCTSWDTGRCSWAGCGLGPVEFGTGVTEVVWRWAGLIFGYVGPTLYGPGPSEPGGPRLLWGVCNLEYTNRILTSPGILFYTHNFTTNTISII
jgi:hypothetical protein